MRFAIGFARLDRQAAEPEFLGCGVANGPFAGPLGQLHQAELLGLLLDLVHLGQRLGADLVRGGLRRQRLAGGHDGLARRRAGGCGRGCARLIIGLFLDLGRGLGGRLGRGFGRGLRLGLRLGGRAGRRCSRGSTATGAVGEPEAMHLADHGIAGDAAQLLGDLAGGLPLGPHLLEQLDAFIGPGHGRYPFLGLEAPWPGLSCQRRHAFRTALRWVPILITKAGDTRERFARP